MPGPSALRESHDPAFTPGGGGSDSSRGRQRGFGDYLCYTTIAEGKAEVALATNVQVWDLAAAKILLEEVGGRLTDFGGQDSIANGTPLASNGLLHEAALRLLSGR